MPSKPNLAEALTSMKRAFKGKGKVRSRRARGMASSRNRKEEILKSIRDKFGSKKSDDDTEKREEAVKKAEELRRKRKKEEERKRKRASESK